MKVRKCETTKSPEYPNRRQFLDARTKAGLMAFGLGALAAGVQADPPRLAGDLMQVPKSAVTNGVCSASTGDVVRLRGIPPPLLRTPPVVPAGTNAVQSTPAPAPADQQPVVKGLMRVPNKPAPAK